MSTFSSNPKAANSQPAQQPRFGRMDLGWSMWRRHRAREGLAARPAAPDGYWCGELEADSMLESDYIFMHTLLGTGDPGKMERASTRSSATRTKTVDGALSRRSFEYQLRREGLSSR
jgi:squalene-hopene/tetraprenyl-beta-curcumene cyclase